MWWLVCQSEDKYEQIMLGFLINAFDSMFYSSCSLKKSFWLEIIIFFKLKFSFRLARLLKLILLAHWVTRLLFSLAQGQNLLSPKLQLDLAFFLPCREVASWKKFLNVNYRNFHCWGCTVYVKMLLACHVKSKDVHTALIGCDCLLILNLRPALLEKMPVMESKLSSEPVTNGEVPSQPEVVETKEGTMPTCFSCVCFCTLTLSFSNSEYWLSLCELQLWWNRSLLNKGWDF